MQDCIYRQIDINSRILPFTIKQYDYNSRKVCIALLDADNPMQKKPNLTDNEIQACFMFPDGSIETVIGEVLDPPELGKFTFLIPNSVIEQTKDVKCEVVIFGPKNSDGKYTERLSLRAFAISIIESVSNDQMTETLDNTNAVE